MRVVLDTNILVSALIAPAGNPAAISLNTPNGRRYTYGGGGGVGLQFTPRATWLWQPIFDVPTPNTRRVNMTLDFGRGILIPVKGNHAMRTGVWFFHFSDGNCALPG